MGHALTALLLAAPLAAEVSMPKNSSAGSARKAADGLAALANITEHTLANGLTVRLAPSDHQPTISYYTFFKVGSRNERPGATGISHLFEHMMFNGSKRFGPGVFDRLLESNGGTSNAYTSQDLTVYHDDFAAEALETVIDLEADRMRALVINDRLLERERQVVIEERRLRVDNDVLGMVDEELNALVYKAHPYRWPIIGWMKDIERISRRDCVEYFRTYYAPNNATVYVVGDFEPRKALALIKRHYGDIPKGPPPPPVPDAEPEQKGERRAEVRYPAQAPMLMIGYRGPPARHPDTLVLDIIQFALSVGDGSRLVRELVYEQHLAVSARVDWSWKVDSGVFVIDLELRPDSDPSKVERAVYAELERLAREGIGERELVKAKNNLRAHLLMELATNTGRANAFGTHEALLGSWREVLSLPDRYLAISAEQVKAAAAKYFEPTQRSVVTLVPSGRP